MQVSRLRAAALFLLLTLLSVNITARGQDARDAQRNDTARGQDAQDDEPDDYDVKARVVRVSLMIGEVNLKRNGSQEWELVRLNYPLVEGDTIATGKDSRVEIQLDARNFIRLAPGAVMRIVTLREEGTAWSVVEGTVTVRLAKLDRSREYFELDAPRTTLAIEKNGSYRIDVPREGRVRLTVRDGGLARIYSDTSGFSLRDERSAELVVRGENAGDWDLFAAGPRDLIDQWVGERERYLAGRFRYEDKYFDEDVWGAEDLGNYGDWTKSSDYGWVWQPHASVINAFSDWAPYRYGHWTWCPPYGWTWVGYEPWGWAPYHYGRWVFHNSYWVWVPRSHFNKKRSWWRPALVAFVHFSFSFGDNICWYPLDYYQRDPYSRHYRRHDRHNYGGGGRRDGDGRYGGGGRRDGDGRYAGGGRRDGDGRSPGGRDGTGGREGGGEDRERPYSPTADYKPWRGVTRVPRTTFGREPGHPVDEPVARRVLESEPEIENLPRRVGLAGSIPAGDGASAPRRPAPAIIQRPTGAAEREPGVALDDDLRRSRVYRGREPRSTQPTQQPSQPPAATSNAPARNAPVEQTPANTPNVPPSGALERPETPSRPAPTRMARPAMRD